MLTPTIHRPLPVPDNPGATTTSSRLMRASGLTLLGLLLAACGGGGGDAAATTASRADASALDQINAARGVARTCGTTPMPAAPPLRWNTALEQAAIGHSEWMQANGMLSHTGASGSDAGARATAAGYAWRMIGENIAAGPLDVASVLEVWLASPGHCMNIMHPDFVDVALAMKPGTSPSPYRTWWTLDLGQPR